MSFLTDKAGAAPEPALGPKSSCQEGLPTDGSPAESPRGFCMHKVLPQPLPGSLWLVPTADPRARAVSVGPVGEGLPPQGSVAETTGPAPAQIGSRLQ